MERFYLKSFGCKVSQYDGQGLRERFIRAGMAEMPTPEEADILVVNFCVVTGRSASRCLRTLKGLVRRQPSARIVVAGCLSPADKEKVRATYPRALVLDGGDSRKTLDEIAPAEHPGAEWQGVHGLEGHTRAFVKVQDGCNLGCTYCIIPSIRGQERSRPAPDVLDEVRRLLETGYRELVLCGIRLGGYRHETMRLQGLLETILDRTPGDFRIRLSSLNPAEVTPGLLDIMAGDTRVARHLHLPLQSGDPEILKRMKRPYSPARFLSKAAEFRKRLPNPAISTDLLVGFPGENDRAFQQSLDLLCQARVSRVHIFPYSIRQGTPAAGFDQVHDGVKTERVKEAQAFAGRLKAEFDRSCLGSTARVLIEGRNRGRDGLPEGLTSRYQKTLVSGLAPAQEEGSFVDVKLEEYEDGLFIGRATKEVRHER